MGLTIYAAKALLNAFFGKTSDFGALGSVPTLYLGVSSTTPGEDGSNITEPSSGSYARVATTSSDWVAATTADPSVVANAEDVVFPAATADWLAGADLTHAVLFDASSSGNALLVMALDVAKNVLSGDTLSFPAGDLTISLD